jgi:hypothetical protein
MHIFSFADIPVLNYQALWHTDSGQRYIRKISHISTCSHSKIWIFTGVISFGGGYVDETQKGTFMLETVSTGEQYVRVDCACIGSQKKINKSGIW